MRKILILLGAVAITALPGCSSMLAGTEHQAAIGTHTLKVTPDGAVDINTRTISGAPDVEIIKTDGTKIIIKSTASQRIEAVRKALE